MQKAMREALLHTNVTKAQFGILQVLERIQRASSATLARTLTVSPQAMVGVIASLEVKGFIKRRATSSASARILVAQLTPKGRAAFSAAAERFALLDTALESAFTEAERHTMVELLARMRTVLDSVDQSSFKGGSS
jgi:DNA-binding MarR family transcriptional regulator